jgi:hypothetical protein
MPDATYTGLMGFLTQPRWVVRRRRLTLACGLLLACWIASPASAQVRRPIVFGQAGGASIGHADSTQGRAPMVGAAASVPLTPRILLDGDVHVSRVTGVFGRDDHSFTETMYTASLLWRTAVGGNVHAVAGGGLGLQRAHTEFSDPTIGRFNRTETLRLLHGRAGIEVDVSRRLVLRTEGVLWFGTGLDWVVGARAGLGYRF